MHKYNHILQITSAAETTPSSPDLDDFTSTLTSDDARVLVDLLKLAVSRRAGEKGKAAIAHVLTALGKTHSQVNTCVYTCIGLIVKNILF